MWYVPDSTVYKVQGLPTSLCCMLSSLLLPTGTANNAGAILVLGRDLVVVPKLIHPLPPAISSPEASPDRIDDTWMQVLLIVLFLMSEIEYISTT